MKPTKVKPINVELEAEKRCLDHLRLAGEVLALARGSGNAWDGTSDERQLIPRSGISDHTADVFVRSLRFDQFRVVTEQRRDFVDASRRCNPTC